MDTSQRLAEIEAIKMPKARSVRFRDTGRTRPGGRMSLAASQGPRSHN